MSFAMIEVEAMAKKAAKGAGFSWGMAEDAAKAARWLCEHGQDGVGALASSLTDVDGADHRRLSPKSLAGDWVGDDGLNPLIAGTTLADAARFWADEGKKLDDVRTPVLLLPFAAIAARRLASCVTISCGDFKAITDGYDLSISGTLTSARGQVFVSVGGDLVSPEARSARATPSPKDWSILEAFAHRTYAPDTEESRKKGAGAGVQDND